MNKVKRWAIRNGRGTRFWKDKWVGDQLLLDLAIQQVPLEDQEKMVADYVADNNEWAWDSFQGFLTE